MWKSIARNKRSITLDLRCAEGQELVRRLVEHADVAIFNTRPQTLRKWGLDYEPARGQRPDRDAAHHRLRPERAQE